MPELNKIKKGTVFYDELGRKCTVVSIVKDGERIVVFNYFQYYREDRKRLFYKVERRDVIVNYLKLGLYTLKKRRIKK